MTQARILVVEDDVALLEGMHESLELSGYGVTTAQNGLLALAVLEAAGPKGSLPDLIVSDIMMPDMDGYQFLAAVRADRRWMGLPFIFLTARATRQDIRSGRRQGADDYLTKPFSMSDLLAAIESRLQRHAELESWNETRLGGMKRRILTALNHEFRTPLNYVVAYSDLLVNGSREVDPEDVKKYLGEIHRGGERLMKLVEDFLLLAEFETGQAARTFKLRQEVIPNLKVLVEAIVDEFRSRAEKAGLELQIETERDPPATRGDYQYLSTAIRHMVDNAVKFTLEEGTLVKVELSHDDAEVTVAVSDDGIGIAPDDHERVFELFYQADRDRWEQQGVGAGLTIVKWVADLHRGRVEVASKPGKGSCFKLRLPVDAGGIEIGGPGAN